MAAAVILDFLSVVRSPPIAIVTCAIAFSHLRVGQLCMPRNARTYDL